MSFPGTGTPPTVPASLQVYNSYVEDPKWQGKFTAIWCSFLAGAIVISIPTLVHAFRQGRAFTGLFGLSEGKTGYSAVISEENTAPLPSSSKRSIIMTYGNSLLSVRQWSVRYLNLNVGQIFVLATYLAVTLACIIKDAPLLSNPNRAGFLAFSQFPIVFLFATKNSLLSFLLGPGHGYEQLNFLHRMAGRVMFLAALIHGSLWIRNHIQYKIAILGPQKETSGVAALIMLGSIVLFSLRPIRRLFYQAFFVIHVFTFVGFFVCVCYHSTYASPWILPPVAFYAADILVRLLRYRFKDATLSAPDELMTLVRVHDCNDGWVAGQHISLRVFFSGRLLESHPLSILSAPPSYSCLSNPGLLLGARASGDWTRALNTFVRQKQETSKETEGSSRSKDSDWNTTLPIKVMIDGPYGGSSVDLGQYETAVLLSGGSGVTFTLGLLDDIVGRCVKLRRNGGERTRRIEFVWYIRSYGTLNWFAPMLTDIATIASNSSIDLHISIFVTCLCQPEEVPLIPKCDVILSRPPIYGLLQEFTGPLSPSSSSAAASAEEEGQAVERMDTRGQGGGVAVCASGPTSLTRDAQNAVARLGIVRGIELGGVVIHVEEFAL